MKIRLIIAKERVVVTASVRYKRVFGHIEFFVDTGSDTSFISPTDAVRLKLSPASFPFKCNAKIGGSSLALNKMENVSLAFLNENGEKEELNNPEFLIACGVRKKDETAYSIPSIIGLNFLKEHKLELRVNPAKNEAYLERE